MYDLADFRHADPLTLYEQMRPDQRTAIANEFVRCLTLASDPAADQFRFQSVQAVTRMAAGAVGGTRMVGDMMMLSAAEVARLHIYTREHHPDLFEQVQRHPVTQASLAAPGTPPAEVAEADNKPDDDLGMPPADGQADESFLTRE